MEETNRTLQKRVPAALLFIFVIILVAFSTWQLFAGNLEAAFSSLPFLLIVYLFVIRRRA
jgi:uncharacterized membrane protein